MSIGISVHADELAINTASHLVRDFGLEDYFTDFIADLQRGDIKSARSFVHREFGVTDPRRFKCFYQMENLLKKYCFEQDVYSPKELEQVTRDGYEETQIRLSEHMLTPAPFWSRDVLKCARKHIKAIIGEFDPEEVMQNVQFGKKASIGCPLNLAYIDAKLINEQAFTSSSQGYNWFRGYLETDAHLSQFFAGKSPSIVKSLIFQQVPKTWNKNRGITPLPLVDLFYTFGIGRVCEKRLKVAGLDISRLPNRHRWLVEMNSDGGYLATADLSAASDSLTAQLLNQVLPRSWYNALKRAFFHQMDLGEGRHIYTHSVLPMGNGFTFPVQTLVFYGLLLAIQELFNVRGVISVFGDDLIYPVKMHKYVYRVFEGLGLILNLDKTYAHYPFRESCGEDYYRGLAVRPAQLKTPKDGYKLSGYRLHTHIYKIINVLLRRWKYEEIKQTIDYLLSLINLDGEPILRVPPTYPDQSGLKVSWDKFRLGHHDYSPVRLNFADGSRWFEFKYLYLKYRGRAILAQEPYYWLKLAGGHDEVQDHWSDQWSPYTEAPKTQLEWRSYKRKPVKLPNGKLKKRRRKSKAFVSSRVLREIQLKEVQFTRKHNKAPSDWLAEPPNYVPSSKIKAAWLEGFMLKNLAPMG